MRGASSVFSVVMSTPINVEVISVDMRIGTLYCLAYCIISDSGCILRVRMTAGGWKENSFSSRMLRRDVESSSRYDISVRPMIWTRVLSKFS